MSNATAARKAWFTAPPTYGAAEGYTREDAIPDIVRRNTAGRALYTVKLTAAGVASTLTAATIIGYGADENGQDVELLRVQLAAGPWQAALDLTDFGDRTIVFDAITDPPMPVLSGSIILCNSGKPIDGAHWVPVLAGNGKHAFSETGQGGWEWVRYEDGLTYPRGATLKDRPFLPITEDDFAHDKTGKRTSAQPMHAHLWHEPLAVCGAIPSHEFMYTTDNGRDSFVCVSNVQPYTQNDDWRLRNAQNRDGPYGVGRIGSGICVFFEQNGESALVLSPHPRLARIYIAGPRKGYIETVHGWVLKDSTKPAPRIPLGSFKYMAWAMSFYVYKGGIRDGNPQLNNAWQVWPDERDPSKAMIADTDNERLVLLDLTDGWGDTFAGSLDGTDGDLDGHGTAVRLMKPRGVCQKTGATPAEDVWLVMNDHGCRLCQADRDRNVTTIVRSQSAFPELDAQYGKGINFALVTMVPNASGYKTSIPAIRKYLRDGPFESAIWMHGQQLGLDSDGNPRCPCHHPHVIIKFDLQARTVTTLALLDVNMQAGKLEKSWMTFSIDRFGVVMEQDTMVVDYFLDTAKQVFDKNGKVVGRYTGNDGPTIIADSYLEIGSLRYSEHQGYPWGFAFSQWAHVPVMGYTPTVGDGFFTISKRLPGEPEADAGLHKLADQQLATGYPPAQYRRGSNIMSRLGEPSAYDFVGRPDSELRAWFATWKQAASWPADAREHILDAHVYRARWATQHVIAPLAELPVPDPLVPLRAALVKAQAALEQASADDLAAHAAYDTASGELEAARVAMVAAADTFNRANDVLQRQGVATTAADQALADVTAAVADIQQRIDALQKKP